MMPKENRHVWLYAALIAGLTVSALVMTWPLALNLGTHIPLGSEPSGTVPVFNLWALEWNLDRMVQGYAGYWHAPIFYPTQGTFSLSETHTLLSLPFALFHGLTRHSVVAYNLTLLSVMVLNGVAGVHLSRSRGADWPLAVLVGVMIQTLPFVYHELGVLQLVVLFPVVYALLFLLRLADAPTYRDGVLLGVAFSVTVLTNGTYGLLLSMVIVLGVLVLYPVDHWRVLVLAAVVVGVTAMPLIITQARWLAPYSRTADMVALGSATLRDYGPTAGRHHLWPGIALLVTGGIGVWQSERRRSAFYAASIAVMVAISLGSNLTVWGWQPYTRLAEVIPGFQHVRSPFRAGAFVGLLLAAGASSGLRLPVDRIKRAAISVVIITLSLWQVRAPLPLYAIDDTPQPWVMWLADEPTTAPIAMVPFPPSGQTAAYTPTVHAMRLVLDHRHPMVNGYSGYFPAGYLLLWQSMATFPDDLSVSRLQRTGVRYIVVDGLWLTPARHEALTGYGFRPVFEGNVKSIYTVP